MTGIGHLRGNWLTKGGNGKPRDWKGVTFKEGEE